ncbi:DUF4388 domain-containing protein [Deinococcus maricopensis]|uniref:PatA-like N-terminal domain-containing protein n=1 Tax=Deinococcus maricopensis (strain DSM 21211 / LMG 22137 / NRRL B-23946 / LB-34) TaxID=709986 RepID=E8UBA4_DEIML|nr:DUF4388 domain-containing protein [Deinococcus maricopensis]ADV68343.1 hypothetical protein Deima_2713 [Deinococcus maricopensis DSM 21211]
MQGLISDVPLIGVLELIHVSRKTGVLDVDAEIPYTLAFVNGEVVEGGILDWLGLDAIYSGPLVPEQGQFTFSVRDVTGAPIQHYQKLSADWARFSDEWERVCEVIGSPSRVLVGDHPGFEEARSVRAVARTTDEPLFEVAQRAAEAVAAGKLHTEDRFAWFGLRIRRGDDTANHPIAQQLDGDRNLGDIVGAGNNISAVRAFLLDEIRAGRRFAGSGWVLRDLVWEQRYLEGGAEDLDHEAEDFDIL